MSWAGKLGTLGLLLVLTACQHQQEPDVAPAPPPQEVRHDVEPLVLTFPALGTPVSASWITWSNTGGDLAPGALKLQWIDAVVHVAPATMNELVSQHQSQDSGNRPAVQKVLEAELPPGPFLTGVELNILFGVEAGRSTRVFLDPPRDTVVLQSGVAS